MALGARPAQVLQLFLKQGLRVVLAGIFVGLIASASLARLLAGLLYGVRPADPLTLTFVAATLGAVAVAAIYGPARRAAHTDPLTALRHE